MATPSSLKFKKNESFYIRDGWLEKAINTIYEHDDVFSKNNGTLYLGIGSNMVKSLKYWLNAAGLVVSSSSKTTLTELGELIYKYDRYFESDFTWFLIHYKLSTNLRECPVSYCTFNSTITSFKKPDLESVIYHRLIDEGYDVKSEYIDEDLSVTIKSYVSDDIVTNPEDNYVCPLSSLNLMKKTRNGYEKTRSSTNSLSPLIIYYALSELYKSESFNIEDSYEEDTSPCLVFNLDRNTYLQYLSLLRDAGLISINKTAGLNVVYFSKPRLSLKDLFEREFSK